MKAVRSILLGACSFLVVLVGLDLWLQAAEIACPLENRSDPELGPVYRPNVRFSRFSEGFFLGGANRWGFLGRGAPPARERGELRVLLFGDSFVLGHTVFERDHFKETLARDLGARLGREVVVLNFARADYCLWNMHQHYVDHASRWDHDLALFFVADGDLAPAYPADPAMYPWTEAAGDSLRVNRDFRDSAKRRLYLRLEPALTRLALPRLGFEVLKAIDTGEWRRLVLGRFAPAAAAPGDVQLGDVPGPLPAAALARRGREFPATSRLILEDLARRGRCAAVIEWEIRAAYRDAVLASGIPTVELAPLWAELIAAGRDPWSWPATGERGHWNHVAHRAMGERLAAEIIARGWLD
ncbi:MAG TPA: hypothetical protein PLL30_08950 [Candidatus Krumholzibacteria bacterium]|nr:hypothetical protein [Candidatus Krumholzibacteria bacterium]HPD71887.1 hypothetical protein [Candidatus Krumholzibacteria bacterium]HRY41180.1 hypothetical protein [Candidatus Krumholzibacteria bacterium]